MLFWNNEKNGPSAHTSTLADKDIVCEFIIGFHHSLEKLCAVAQKHISEFKSTELWFFGRLNRKLGIHSKENVRNSFDESG